MVQGFEAHLSVSLTINTCRNDQKFSWTGCQNAGPQHMSPMYGKYVLRAFNNPEFQGRWVGIFGSSGCLL